MRSIATTRVTILRGETTNAFGDPAAADTRVADRVPFSILQSSARTTRRADDRPNTVLAYIGRCSPRVDVRQEDRLIDERTGDIFLVTEVSRTGSTVTTNDSRVTLEKVTVGTL